MKEQKIVKLLVKNYFKPANNKENKLNLTTRMI